MGFVVGRAVPDGNGEAIVQSISVGVGSFGYWYTRDCPANLLQDHKRLLWCSRVTRQQDLDRLVRKLPHELRLPIVAPATRKEAVASRLNLHIGYWSNPVLDGRTIIPQTLE